MARRLKQMEDFTTKILRNGNGNGNGNGDGDEVKGYTRSIEVLEFITMIANKGRGSRHLLKKC